MNLSCGHGGGSNFHGSVKRDALSLYAKNDIFIFPSLVEGTPLAVQEAMAAGMAVITTETCGMVDLIENDYNGLLIPPADSVALENAIWRLSQDPQLRMKLGQAAQESMRRFTWARTIEIVWKMLARASCVDWDVVRMRSSHRPSHRPRSQRKTGEVVASDKAIRRKA